MEGSFLHYDLGGGVTLFRGYIANGRLTFNSYLIQSQKTVLMHTGPVDTWQALRSEIQKRIPIETLDYVVVPHFESDECGALHLLLRESNPNIMASAVGERQIRGFGLADNVRVVADGDTLVLGKDHILEFLSVPSEMHLWEGLMVYDRTQRVLYSNDFLSQFGPEIGVEDKKISIIGMRKMHEGNIPCVSPYKKIVERLSKLQIQRVAPGHGSIIKEDIEELIQRYFSQGFD